MYNIFKCFIPVYIKTQALQHNGSSLLNEKLLDYNKGNGSKLHEDKIAREHKIARRQFCTKGQFCTSYNFARK